MNGTPTVLAIVVAFAWCLAFAQWWASKPNDRSWWGEDK